MAAISKTSTAATVRGNLRPFNPSLDSTAVADLVELCFSDTLDQDGRRYLQSMRTAARSPGFFFLANAAEEWSGVPLSGFVWEEDGRVVGNLSLIPYRSGDIRHYLIANVAVHPDYRRLGIARTLTLKGIESARWKGGASVWLHVREENEPAVTLYSDLGFIERATRTTWYSSHAHSSTPLSEGIHITPRSAEDWETQVERLESNYPIDLRWNLPLKLPALRPGLAGGIYRFFTATAVRQWAAWKDDTLLGVLSCQASLGGSSLLWLASTPEHEDLAAQSLLNHARSVMGRHASFVLDYPAHRASKAIDGAGFYTRQILVWMQIVFR